ncbi:MAG: class I tRNA ligase family protein, partial [Candidatus Pacebacteria bacterium]|nr:class I tRNA ligase family protein [Candidatus Paceibacterota bacterium]
NWFYVLLVMSRVLENKAPFKNLLGFASVVDEKGEEMHKSKGNAIWFDTAVEKIGADVMRWMYVVQNPATNMRFGYNVAKETERKILTLVNCVKFFETYADKPKVKSQKSKIRIKSQNLLDQWVLSRLHNLIKATTESLNKFDAMKATLAIENFWINDLSLWYVRRSRKRFQASESQKDKEQAENTFYNVLLTTAKLIAPLMPFLAESIYQALRDPVSGVLETGSLLDFPQSVHLCQWPKANNGFIDEKIERDMQDARDIVSLALAKRAEFGIGVRQALRKIKIQKSKFKNISQNSKVLDLIKDEINVKEIVFDETIKDELELDITITDELKEEGQVREIIRYIQDLRKKAGLTPSDTNIVINYFTNNNLKEILQKNKVEILSATRSKELRENKNKTGNFLAQAEFKVANQDIWLALQR